MQNYRVIVLFVLTTFISACSTASQYQKKGNVSPEKFNQIIDFTTIKTVILLPVEVDGVSKSFLFDTGADVSVLQRDSLMGKTTSFSGASNRKMELGKEIVKSMKIGEIDFQNIFAVNGNLEGLKEQIPKFGGILGQTVIQSKLAD
ncbi:MAG: hypothetical protein ACJAWV_003645 [Flammeovirgaceae bacterium]|jgi:hypothetical protein